MVFSTEMLSMDGLGVTIPNKLTMHVDGNRVYITIEANHGGQSISSVVVVERRVWRYHMMASGVLSIPQMPAADSMPPMLAR